MLLIALLGTATGAFKTDTPLLTENVEDFMNDYLGVADFQQDIADADVTTVRLDSEDLVRKVTDAISKRLKEAEAAVLKFGFEVGNAIKKNSWTSKAPMATDNMQSVLRQYPQLSFQYATRLGAVIQYASPNGDHFPEDHPSKELQDWYIPTIYPAHKLVVVVLDSSSSMQVDGRYELAQTGVMGIMDALSSSDNIALVSYGRKITRATDPGQALACKDDKMSRATKANVDLLRRWLSTLKPDGDSSLKSGLEAAFDYFDYEGKSTERDDSDRILVVISGSTPQDDTDNLVKAVKARSDDLGGRLVIFAYGIGSSAPHATLQSIAAESTMANMNKGVHHRVDDKSDMYEKTSRFYEELMTAGKTTSAKWSSPHLDKVSEEWAIKASVPVFASDEFEGVAAVEMPVKNLAVEAVYLNEGSSNVYSFVMDKEFDVMAHSFWSTLPRENATLPSIAEIETSDKIEASLLPKIRQLKNGGIVTESIPGTSRIIKGQHYATYVQFDGQISCKFLEDTPYVVCVVVGEDSDSLQFQGLPNPGEDVFTYHRFDLLGAEKLCIHFGRFASRGSAVSFSPKALIDQGRYLEKETKSDAYWYKPEVQGSQSKITGLARADILLTYSLDEFWRKHELDRTASNKLEYFVPWRYVGTESGVFRMRPGMEMPKGYNFMYTAWYQMARNFPNDVVITPPHSIFGVQVISIAKAIQIDGEGGKQFHGAVGFDVLFAEFYEAFYRIFDDCEGLCLVLDRSGYVIFSHDHHDGWKPHHFTEVVPTIIPELMLSKGLLVEYNCTITASGVVDQWNVFDISAFDQSATISEDGYYEVQLISGTNAIFLNIPDEVADMDETSDCPKDLMTHRMCSDDISCPCYHWTKPTFCSATRNPNPPPCFDADPYIQEMELEFPGVDFDDEDEFCYDHFEEWRERAGIDNLGWLWITIFLFFCTASGLVGLCVYGLNAVENESEQDRQQQLRLGQAGVPGTGIPPGGTAPPLYDDAKNLPGMQQQGPQGGFFGATGFQQQPGFAQPDPGSFGNPQSPSMFAPPGGQHNQFSGSVF